MKKWLLEKTLFLSFWAKRGGAKWPKMRFFIHILSVLLFWHFGGKKNLSGHKIRLFKFYGEMEACHVSFLWMELDQHKITQSNCFRCCCCFDENLDKNVWKSCSAINSYFSESSLAISLLGPLSRWIFLLYIYCPRL